MIKKRNHYRVPFSEPVKLTFDQLGPFITQYSLNISEEGMFIITERPYPVGTRFQFEFTLKGGCELVAGEAEVRWIKEKGDGEGAEKGGMGVKFITLRPGSRELIQWFTEYRTLKLALDEDSEDEYSPLLLLDRNELRLEMDRIARSTLPDTILPYTEMFSKVSERNPFLWKWCYEGAALTTLPCIDRSYFRSVVDTKLIGFIFAVLADDISDQMQDLPMLNEACKIPLYQETVDFRGLDRRRYEYLQTTLEIWNVITERVRAYPRYKELADVFLFDYLQYLNALRYSYLVNKNPCLLNMAEHDLYQHHNMHIMISSTIDLMCSPGFDMNELGLLREVVLKAQQMGRIGNMITTWEREIKDRDFSSGIYPYLIERGIFTPVELQYGDPEQIREKVKTSGSEKHFLSQWEIYHRQLCDLSSRIRSVDLTKFIRGFEKLIRLHLGSVGLK